MRGLFDGISGTWMRQMSYSMCRFWAYEESKKYLGAGKDAPAWKLALAGSMGTPSSSRNLRIPHLTPNLRSGRYCGSRRESRRCVIIPSADSRAVAHNGHTEIVMVRLQGDFAKPPEKRFNYKHCFDALFRVSGRATHPNAQLTRRTRAR